MRGLLIKIQNLKTAPVNLSRFALEMLVLSEAAIFRHSILPLPRFCYIGLNICFFFTFQYFVAREVFVDLVNEIDKCITRKTVVLG